MTLPPLALLSLCRVSAFALQQFFPIATFDPPVWVISVTAASAVVFLVSAVVKFRSHQTTVNPITPEATTTLVTGGVYRITRNPMYVGMLLALISLVLWLGALSATTLVPVFYALIDRKQIAAEEAALLQKFGDTYRAYAASVPRWLLIRQGVEK